VVNRYDLTKEFPAITLRKTAIKSCTNEMLWIWQQKSNNIHDLKSTVWDEWADETGSIGKAYGYQVGKKYAHHKAAEEDLSRYPSAEIRVENGVSYVFLDQIDGVRYDLVNNPFSRRILANIYNLEDLHEMHLYPCAYSLTFNVTTRQGSDKLVLNAILNQRSQDILAANNWNVCQYAILLHMLARDCDMEVGELVHVIADAHIYDRHIPIVKELITRPQYPAPVFTLNPEVKDFYQFTADDIKIENYVTGEQIKNIPIAV
jgi:thymidylate synthase